MSEIHQKWGFGMAPVKEVNDVERFRSIESFRAFCRRPTPEVPDIFLEEISIVKGLFMRVAKQDQWDWFTVFDRLGRPGRVKCRKVASSLKNLRNHIKSGSGYVELRDIVEADFPSNVMKHLSSYLGHKQLFPDVGQIYVLSTRDQPDILKIGYTERSVWERVKEINASTGVLVPYGVRAVWAVESARIAEKEIHQMFDEYRVRADREFFRIPYSVAFKKINDLIIKKRIREAD